MDYLKVGIVGLHWPPDFGGAERYINKVVEVLNGQGVEAWGITPRPAAEGKDNGTKYVHRIGDTVFGIDDSKRMLEWWKILYAHVEQEGYTHIIFNNCHVHAWAFTDVFATLKEMGVKVGAFHFDVKPTLLLSVVEKYTECGDWDEAIKPTLEAQKALFEINNPLFHDIHPYFILNSPLFFRPDFVISCSKWSECFIDPLNTTPKFVLHPVLDDITIHKERLERKTITMINPQYHKGRSYMADIINNYSNRTWTYRVLLGGYGGEKEEFKAMIADSWAVQDGRVEILDYVERMEDVWESTDLFIFPSRFEGYGMAAVEPMIHGVPVMVQDYPSVREAVGDGAIIMPYECNSKEWIETIEELFFDDEEYEEIRQKGYERVRQLRLREADELSGLITFMEKLA